MLIATLLDIVKNELSKPDILWENSEASKRDLEFLKTECMKESEFDVLNKRKTMYNQMIQGKSIVVFKKCKYGQIFAICDNANDIPWELWGRILRMYYEGKQIKVFFLAHPSLRTFPKGVITSENINAEFITPENINGGYTYTCNTETIVIYRAEDATRVLIHELQHASCLDKHHSIDLLEAETEAWAELIYIGLLSGGKKCIFNDICNRQSEWIVKQNARVKKYIGNTRTFPWRYTVGKEEVWRRWNILTKFTSGLKVNSLRLTFPPNEIVKRRFNVSKHSTIL